MGTFFATFVFHGRSALRFASDEPSLYPEALSRYSRDRYGSHSRGPYTSDHTSHSGLPLVSNANKVMDLTT